MSLLVVDGFPYSTPTAAAPKKWTTALITNGGTLAVLDSSGRFGGRWLQLTSGYVWGIAQVTKTLGNFSELCAQFGYNAITYSTNQSGVLPIIMFMDTSAAFQVSISSNSGLIQAHRGHYASGTLLGTAATAISTAVWHQIEIKIVFHQTAGSILVKADGETLLNLTDIDTAATTNEYCNVIRFDCGQGSQMTGKIGISDLIVMDTTGDYCNDLLGARMVELKVPTGDGNYSMFRPSTSPGDNHSMVDEVPPDDDTTYNTGDVDDVDTFTKEPISNPTAIVDAISCSIYCKTNDGGSASIKGVVRSGAVDGYGTELSVPSSYDHRQSFIYLDPNTAAQFTAAGINAAELGYKRTA